MAFLAAASESPATRTTQTRTFALGNYSNMSLCTRCAVCEDFIVHVCPHPFSIRASPSMCFCKYQLSHKLPITGPYLISVALPGFAFLLKVEWKTQHGLEESLESSSNLREKMCDLPSMTLLNTRPLAIKHHGPTKHPSDQMPQMKLLLLPAWFRPKT